MKPLIALTCGEPAGVGPELSFAAWECLKDELDFFLIADRKQIASVATSHPFCEIIRPTEAREAMQTGLPLLHHDFSCVVKPGAPNHQNASAVIEVIRRGVDLVKTGLATALCTNPINKQVLKEGANFAFPGHTEFLAHLGDTLRPVMMLSAPELRVVPVTIHIPLATVPAVLSDTLLEETILVTNEALKRDFSIARPRLAVAGLNPHAGEGGTMGHEETTLIAPVLDRLRAQGLDIKGPMSADTMFHPDARATYDAAICMYHDQALIPIKTLDFHGGTNITLGLPFVRTSPDHGTAFDIAGKGRADPSSLIAALRQAAAISIARASQT